MNFFSQSNRGLKIRKYVSNGNTKLAIEELLKIEFSDTDIRSSVEIISARFYNLNKSIIEDRISPDAANVETNRINKAILDLLNESFKSLNVYSIILKSIAILITALIAIGLFNTFIHFQRNEKVKLAIQEYKEFKNNEDNKIAMQLLDYNQRTIDLYPKDNNDAKVIVRDDLLEQALNIHLEKNKFTETEARVREIFDSFFDNLGIFHKYVENNMLEKKDIDELKYWIEILASEENKRKPKYLKEKFKEYIVFYKFENLRRLCLDFGYSLD